MDERSFHELIERVRAGDQEAAAALVEHYEPEIRREVRFRLTDRKLRTVIDSVDVCQSVFGNFFVRATLGQFHLERPRQLLELLVTMARNKVIDWHRRERARGRGRREGVAALHRLDGDEPADPGPTPSEFAGHKELVKEVRKRLTTEERELAEARHAGRSWDEISAERGTSPEALRKRLSRACDRVLGELGLAD